MYSLFNIRANISKGFFTKNFSKRSLDKTQEEEFRVPLPAMSVIVCYVFMKA